LGRNRIIKFYIEIDDNDEDDDYDDDDVDEIEHAARKTYQVVLYKEVREL
jgi:hypothetical protein